MSDRPNVCTVFAGIPVFLHEVSDLGVANSTESQLHALDLPYVTERSHSFLLGSHPFFR